MTSLDVYTPSFAFPFVAQAWQLPYDSLFCATIIATLLMAIYNRYVSNKSGCELNDSVSKLYTQQGCLQKYVGLIDEQMGTAEMRLAALEKRIQKAELLLENAGILMAKQKEAAEREAEDISFACETACTTYVQWNKPHITYMDDQVLKCLEKSPATARQILDYVIENKSLIHQNFFTAGGVFTRHSVNSCLYNLLHQKRVTKSEAMPPVWSVAK